MRKYTREVMCCLSMMAMTLPSCAPQATVPSEYDPLTSENGVGVVIVGSATFVPADGQLRHPVFDRLMAERIVDAVELEGTVLTESTGSVGAVNLICRTGTRLRERARDGLSIWSPDIALMTRPLNVIQQEACAESGAQIVEIELAKYTGGLESEEIVRGAWVLYDDARIRDQARVALKYILGNRAELFEGPQYGQYFEAIK